MAVATDTELVVTGPLTLTVAGTAGKAGATGPAGPAGVDGVGISAGTIDATGHLVFTMTNGATLDVGAIPTGAGNGVNDAPPAQAILTMPAGIADGAPVTLGTGPDQIGLLLSNNPNDSPRQCVFAVLMDGTAVAGPLVCTSWTGYGAGQVFTLNGTWGPTAKDGTPHEFTIVSAGAGDRAMWVNSLSYNLVRIKLQNGGDDHVWLDQGQDGVFGGIVVVAAPPPPPITYTATPSQITAVLDGATKTDTLANLTALMTATSALTLPPGRFIASALVPGGTITGAPLDANGAPTTTLDCTGLAPVYGKGVLVPNGDCTIKNLALTGATLGTPGSGSTSGSYAAGIRDNVNTLNVTLESVECYGNDMGIESLGSNYTCTDIYLHDNGMSDGYSHEAYFQQGPTAAGVVKIAGKSRIIAGPKATHALKSRQYTTQVESGVTISGNGSAAAWCGAVIDIPNGGVFAANAATIVLPAGSANILYLGFGEENNQDAAAGASAAFLACIFQGMDGKIENSTGNTPSATLDVTGTTSQGAITTAGWASVTGTIAKAA